MDCKQCGKDITKGKYCSDKCRMKYNRANKQPEQTRTELQPEQCPDDWLDKINSLPVGVVRPLFGVTGELRDKTHRQLQSTMPRTCWQSSQEYAEVIYRLLYWTEEQLSGCILPSWWGAGSRDYVGVAV